MNKLKFAIKYYVSSVAVLLFASCNQTESISENELKINPNEAREVNLSEFVDTVEYIKLQTDSSCIMGRISKLIIKNKYIYVFDQEQMIMFVFDKQGRFVTKLDKRGKGKDEYNILGRGVVDEKENFVEIIDLRGENSRVIKYSNISFNFIQANPIPGLQYGSFKRHNNVYYFSALQQTNIVQGKKTNADIIVVENGEIAGTLFNKTIQTNNSSFAFYRESFTLNNEGELFVSLMYKNTFYKLEDKKAYPFLTLDFGNKSIDNSIGLRSTTEQQEYILNTKDKIIFPVLNIKNSIMLNFSYLYLGNGIYNYMILNEENRVFHSSKIMNDITDFPNEIMLHSSARGIAHEVWHKGYLVDVIQASHYFNEDKTEEYIENVGLFSIYDNPIIILMKLKK